MGIKLCLTLKEKHRLRVFENREIILTEEGRSNGRVKRAAS
jgi:hypothetical protein